MTLTQLESSLQTQAPTGTNVTAPNQARHSRGFYHPELDALRFFAFLLVFFAHSDYNVFDPRWAPIQLIANLCYSLHGAGFSGVALFFTLSSYLITELLLKEQQSTGTIHFQAFYVRRLLRIWPLYFFFLLVVRPIAGHFLAWEHFSRADYLSFLLLAGNWQCIFSGWPPSVAAPLWSISIEEQFYLLWPIFVSRLRSKLPVMCIGMLIVANLTRVLLVIYPGRDTAIWCNTFARLDPFALGGLLAFVLHGREFKLAQSTRTMIIVFSLVLLMLIGKYGDHTDSRAVLSYPVESFACLLILFAVLRPMASWTPGRPGRALIYLGRISYGLYVYHLLLIKLLLLTRWGFWVRQPLALASTIACAAASYSLLEKPFLQLKQRFTIIRSRL